MKPLCLTDLATITGGVTRTTAGCPTPDQFNWMVAHMVPDNMSKPGIQHHVVAADARRCGYRMPSK